MTVYQAPVGVWRSTAARRLLWAAEQVLHRLTREVPEQPQVDEYADTFETLIAQPVLDFDWEAWHGKVTKADEDVPAELDGAWDDLPVVVRDMWGVAAAARAEGLSLPFDEGDLDEAIEGSFTQVKGTTVTQREALRNLMRLALEEEEGQFAFARRIRSEWSTFSKQRAEVIAVTEWNRAASVATRLGYKKAGVERLRWFTAGDRRVCARCSDNSAAGEILIDDEFPSGDQEPPAHPSCRCNISSA